jgi:DUF1365 family protein
MRSCFYEAVTTHERLRPVARRFRYRQLLFLLDLAELPGVFAGRRLFGVERRAVASFRRADHLGDPAIPLERAVRERVAQETGWKPRGPIALLTQLRQLGWLQNPVSFYYCYDAAGRRVEAIVADVTSTPWKERHAYVLRRDGEALRFRTRKRLHVSPFMEMDQEYAFRFSEPGERLEVSITSLAAGRPLFRAELAGERRELRGAAPALALLRHPLGPLKVSAAIHWQALRLALRGVPFHPHPRSASSTPRTAPEEAR